MRSIHTEASAAMIVGQILTNTARLQELHI